MQSYEEWNYVSISGELVGIVVIIPGSQAEEELRSNLDFFLEYLRETNPRKQIVVSKKRKPVPKEAA